MEIVIGADHAGYDLKQNLIEYARQLVHAYLAAQFSGEDRHRRRSQKVAAIEARYQYSDQ
jgi:ribose 5-phosphate isomerase RpiB